MSEINAETLKAKEGMVEDFCENRWIECAAGIHFFVNRQEAVEY